MKEQEQLVSFDTAVLAKKKGFSWSTVNHYCYDTVGDYNKFMDDLKNSEHSFNECTAPTQSLLQKWLRDYGHGDWAILVYLVPYISKKPRMEQCFIWRRGELITLEPKNTYEEALEEGLQEALKLIQS